MLKRRRALSRHRHLHPRPSSATLAVAAGTLVAGLIATAVVVGPTSASASPPAHSFGLTAAVAGAASHGSTSLPIVSKERTALVAARQAEVRKAAALELARARAAARRAAARRAAARQAAASQAASSPAASQPPAPSGSPQQIAIAMLPSFGWSTSQFSCLDPLWTRESGWNPYASNPTSGAYGIPQALPGSKMASAGADWQTNPATQIKWGLGYIQATYGSPCAAWAHETTYGWY
ncbi:MAG: aggregation-promoting factor C-terminal-like domain-containing protein [Streptosporangiaceae bacterium]